MASSRTPGWAMASDATERNSGTESKTRRVKSSAYQSGKRGWELDRFPMQDEHENGGQVGMLRPGADTHAECREPEPRTDTRVPTVEPKDQVCWLRAGGDLRLGRAHVGGARVRKFGQGRARTRPSVRGEGNGVER